MARRKTKPAPPIKKVTVPKPKPRSAAIVEKENAELEWKISEAKHELQMDAMKSLKMDYVVAKASKKLTDLVGSKCQPKEFQAKSDEIMEKFKKQFFKKDELNGTTCEICDENFKGGDGKKAPILLLCGHSVCRGCLNTILRIDNQGVDCPFCRLQSVRFSTNQTLLALVSST